MYAGNRPALPVPPTNICRCLDEVPWRAPRWAPMSHPPSGPCPYCLGFGFIYYAGRGSDEWVDGRSVFLSLCLLSTGPAVRRAVMQNAEKQSDNVLYVI